MLFINMSLKCEHKSDGVSTFLFIEICSSINRKVNMP